MKLFKGKSKVAAPTGPAEFPAPARPDGHLGWLTPTRKPALARIPLWDLGSELLLRLRAGKGFARGDAEAWLGGRLCYELGLDVDVHNNRFAIRRQADLFNMFFLQAGVHSPALAGATFVEVGCGSLNPFGTLFVFQMLGARRGIAVDLDEVVDLPRACVALAELAGTALVDPAAVLGSYPITPAEILRNLQGHDLARLRRGDPSGLDPARMEFRRNSVLELTLEDACADVVLSNAFLEHVPQVERAVSELARITKPGGTQVHNIDMSDHRRYAAPRYELDFLREDSREEIVFYSNRVRLHEFEQLFAAAGLSVLSRSIPLRAAVDERTRASFAPRFRAMTVEQLEPVRAVFFLGKQTVPAQPPV